MLTKKRVKLALFSAAVLLHGCAAMEPSRDLASIEATTASEPLDFDTSLYADILSQDTGKKRLKYRMDFRFSTDIDEEHLRSKARAAFQTAIAKTLDTSNPEDREKPIGTRFKQHMLGALITEFVKTLHVFKIVNGTIQVDLTFLPENDDPGSFSAELESNQFVRWDETGNTLSQLASHENPSDVFRLQSFAGHPVIQDQLNNNRYAYVGGSISLWIKLVDMKFDITRPIPNPAKNAVKGTVRFRRVFTAPTMEFTNISCKELSIEKLTFQPEKVGRFMTRPDPKHQFITVDHVKAFNLKQLIPRDESLEIYFGHLLPNHKGRKGLLAADGFKEDPLKTGELVAIGKESPHMKVRHRIGTLTWSFAENGFDLKNSVIKNNVEEKHPGEDDPNFYWSQKWLLEDCKTGLFDALGIERFLPKGAR